MSHEAEHGESSEYVGKHRKVYTSDQPATGEAARILAAEWGVTDLTNVVEVWGQRCHLVRYADGGTVCQKCGSLSVRLLDDDDEIAPRPDSDLS